MKILIADDDPVTRSLLETNLKSWGHAVLQAADGDAAWEIIAGTSIDILVSDWIMPGLDGLQLCKRIRQRKTDDYMYLILISAQDSRADVLEGLQSGIDDYITKPIDMEALRARINIGARIVDLERRLNRKIDIITANQIQIIRMFSQMVEVFDQDLGGHCRRTAKLSIQLAKLHRDVCDAEIPVIEAAGLLHDIGMVAVPKDIINKRRTEMVADERLIYQSHADMGARIIGEIDIMKPAARLIRMHHEQYNGNGFPDQLAGDQIPLGAQLVSAASIYDNMVHRGHINLEDIPQHLQRIRGYQLAPEVVDLLLEINRLQQYELARQTWEECDLENLTAGMVLANNVYMKSGAFVMAADTRLDDYLIDRLKQYHAVGAIIDKVLVHKRSHP
ncbi:MAG: hypothetical protein CR984_02350 [Proteobacteria bacterium]|nr:MAG: hypothetical protein CR984_02350 [Pseudomonadota bacterium]PIE67111.1 MAG: hypothetical protein CSA23_05535 [Deltaproteobacteria bacterium]